VTRALTCTPTHRWKRPLNSPLSLIKGQGGKPLCRNFHFTSPLGQIYQRCYWLAFLFASASRPTSQACLEGPPPGPQQKRFFQLRIGLMNNTLSIPFCRLTWFRRSTLIFSGTEELEGRGSAGNACHCRSRLFGGQILFASRCDVHGVCQRCGRSQSFDYGK
jgi:hypothetical protein